MRAVRWHGRRDVRVDEVPDPASPAPGHVVLAVEWAGICGTDREEWRTGPHWMQTGSPHPLTGQMVPITLGHEVSARVVETADDVEALPTGALVALDALVTCGECWWCLRHEVTLCERLAGIGMHLDGGLADYITVPAQMCIVVAEHVASDTAALAEPIAVAVRGLRRARFAAGESVVVFGAGMVGLGAIAAAKADGASQVAVVAPSQARRDLALAVGADIALDASADDLDERLRELGEGRGADIALEASGDPAAAARSVTAPRRGGRAVIVGFPPDPAQVDLSLLAIDEREVIGSLSHVWDEDMRATVDLLERGVLTADQVVTARIPIEQTVDYGFEHDEWRRLPGAKVLVSPKLSI
jgi:(R,R)-butanediol dehydrogenase/meso-butanediol dehydrogenase/diacetyl reductase